MPVSRFSQFLEALRSLWPQSAARLVNKGSRLRERGKLDEAVAVLNEAIRLDSRMAVAYAHRCGCYCDLHEYAKAMEDANQAVTLAPEKPNAYLWRADAAHRLGQNESAIADLNKALQLAPKDTWIYYKRGSARCAVGDFRAALADVERFLKEHPEEALGYETLAGVRYGLGELDSALVAIDEAVRLDPRYGRCRFFRAGLLWELDRSEEAFAEHEAALALNCEGNEDWRNAAIVRQKWLGGSIALKQENYREAIEQFDAALETSEQSEGVPKSDHRLARVHNDRGDAWYSLGDYERALRHYEEAVAPQPDHPVYYINRAQALMGLRRYVDAERDLVEATRRGPDNVHAYAYLAWFRATCPEAEYRNGKQSVAMAHKAVELGSRHPGSRYCGMLAAAYAEDGNFAEAVRLQAERLAAVPDDVPEEERLECKERLEKYQAGIPHRWSESEDSDS